jgi:8-oxo-dGTP pyrophosphatase MutT (NUDIX family)
MVWTPRVTVASIVERDGRFLCVAEEAEGVRVLNQPAGHLEPGEGLAAAAIRETLEETGLDFSPCALVGVYRWVHPGNGDTYLRFAFSGEAGGETARPLDPDILEACWLTRAEISQSQLRSPLVLRGIDDYLAGRRYPLDLLLEVA